MNWKFWTWREAVRVAEREYDNAVGEYNRLLDRTNALERSLKARAADIEALYATLRFKQRPKAAEPNEGQLLAALVLVREDTPLWRAVHRLIDALEADQKAAVCQGNLHEQRHFNAGRLAMCEDLRDALLQKWTEARKQNHDAQNP